VPVFDLVTMLIKFSVALEDENALKYKQSEANIKTHTNFLIE
jgi:hypothetical protein